MGYRSDVRVMTNLEGFEKMQEIAWELAKEKNIKGDYVLFPEIGADPEAFFSYYDAQEDYLCFGFDWFKWYEDYKDVSLFMDVLAIANENGVPWQFMRVGEDNSDIDNESSDNFYDNAAAVMGITVEITY